VIGRDLPRRVTKRATQALSPAGNRWLRRRRQRFAADPAVGAVALGSLGRTEPIARGFGTMRGGTVVDRVYVERFLGANRAAIRGDVLEVGDDMYSRTFGEPGCRVNVLSIDSGSGAALVADLSEPEALPADAYDCVICTQTLQFTREPAAAARGLARLLRPSGVLLVTVPGISQVSRYDDERWGDRWRFTARAARELFEAAFVLGNVDVRAHGNVLAAAALLYGLVAEDLPSGTLDSDDADYPVIVTVLARI
jgi:hypothetical protein